MKLTSTGFEGLYVLETPVFGDDRGYFFEGYNRNKLLQLGLDINVVQTNISESQAGVVRGLHFQNPPFAQGKLIRVLKGAVLDVVVDIRKASKTFGKCYAIELSEKNKLALWVPVGFAHGFKTLEDETLFYYDCTEAYSKEHEGGIRWNDPEIGIEWGIDDPILSPKDKVAPLLKDQDLQF